MKSKFKNFMMNPWTVGIGTGLILLVVTVAVDLITAVNIFSTLKNVIITIWKWILVFLNFELKVWWVLAGLATVILVLNEYVKYSNKKQQQVNKPPFLDYTKADILGYKWKWYWKKDVYGKYVIEDLHPVCGKCETPLVENLYGYGGRYKCLRCNEGYGNPMPDLDHVKMMISDNVRRRYFPNE